MNVQELEDLTLLLIDDADTPAQWLARWAVSYPVVVTAAVSAQDSVADWQAKLCAAWASQSSGKVAVVAYGAGAAAWLAWLFQADIVSLGRVANMILVSPAQEAFDAEAAQTLQRVRCPSRTAWVLGNDAPQPLRDWAQEWAGRIGATVLETPYPGRLNDRLGGWQWGMKLMQEMLLA